jgi:hypothetical protein
MATDALQTYLVAEPRHGLFAESVFILTKRLLFVAEPGVRHRLKAATRLARPIASEPNPPYCGIAEASEMNRLTLAHLVDRTPGLPLEASIADGLATLASLPGHPPVDLLLLDIEMPHPTGLALLRVLPRPLPAIVLVNWHLNFAAWPFNCPSPRSWKTIGGCSAPTSCRWASASKPNCPGGSIRCQDPAAGQGRLAIYLLHVGTQGLEHGRNRHG